MTEAEVAFNFTPCEHKEFPPNCPFCLQASLGLAEDDADQLAEALGLLGLDYDGAAAGAERQGDGWHYFACPTRHNFPDCDLKCVAAREALRLHEERNASD